MITFDELLTALEEEIITYSEYVSMTVFLWRLKTECVVR